MSWQQLAMQLDRKERRVFDSEDSLQEACVQYWQRFRTVSLLWAVPNGGLRTESESRRLKGTGVMAGIPDLHMITKNKHFFVFELKNGKKGLDPKQVIMKARFEDLDFGSNHFHICSLNEFKAALAYCFHIANIDISKL